MALELLKVQYADVTLLCIHLAKTYTAALRPRGSDGAAAVAVDLGADAQTAAKQLHTLFVEHKLHGDNKPSIIFTSAIHVTPLANAFQKCVAASPSADGDSAIACLLDHTLVDVAVQLRAVSSKLKLAADVPHADHDPLQVDATALHQHLPGLREDALPAEKILHLFTQMRRPSELTEDGLAAVVSTAFKTGARPVLVEHEGKPVRVLALDIEVVNPNRSLDSFIAVGLVAGDAGAPSDSRFRVDIACDGEIDNKWWLTDDLKPILDHILANGIPMLEAMKKTAKFMLEEHKKGPIVLCTDYIAFDWGTTLYHLRSGLEALVADETEPAVTAKVVDELLRSISVVDKDQEARVLLGTKDSERWVSDSDVAKRMGFECPSIPEGHKHEPDYDAEFIRAFYNCTRRRSK